MRGSTLKVDLHVHTVCSRDSLTPLDDVVRWAKRQGLDAVAVTDHNTIAGAKALAARTDFPIIVGEEIRTTRGEIAGLYLEHEIRAGLSPAETIRRIRDQGGLVYVPHPMDRVRRSAIELGALFEIIEQVDVIEVLNARVTFGADNDRARILAQSYDLAMGAGSDAHQGYEIGRAHVEVESIATPKGLLQDLSLNNIQGRLSSPWVHMGSTCAKLAKGIQAFSTVQRRP